MAAWRRAGRLQGLEEGPQPETAAAAEPEEVQWPQEGEAQVPTAQEDPLDPSQEVLPSLEEGAYQVPSPQEAAGACRVPSRRGNVSSRRGEVSSRGRLCISASSVRGGGPSPPGGEASLRDVPSRVEGVLCSPSREEEEAVSVPILQEAVVPILPAGEGPSLQAEEDPIPPAAEAPSPVDPCRKEVRLRVSWGVYPGPSWQSGAALRGLQLGR